MASALNKELWLNDYAAKLTRENTFYTGAKNDSAFVRQAANIVVPNGNLASQVRTITGATSLPLTAVKATADFLEYAPITYAIDPIYVHNVDETEYSFDLRSAVLDEQVRFLQEAVDYKIAYEWTVDSSSSIVASTGSARANVFGNASAKAITYNDVVNAGILLNRQNVPMNGRRLLVSPTMLGDIVKFAEFIDKDELGKQAIIEGFVGRVAGFDVYVTSKLGSFVAAGSKKAISATDLATDLEAAIAFHPAMVRYGIGTKDSGSIGLDFNKAPGFLGAELFEAWVRVGATPSYKEVSNSTTGIVTLKEVV